MKDINCHNKKIISVHVYQVICGGYKLRDISETH